MQRLMLHGRIDPNRIPPEHRAILKGIEEEEEKWLAHMLHLAGDEPKKEKREETWQEKDAELIDDFIHHRGDLA